MNKTKWVSKCCNAETKVVGGDEGTNHWECSKCGESCDATIGATTHGGTWVERFDEDFDEFYLPIPDEVGKELKDYFFAILQAELQQQRGEIVEMIKKRRKEVNIFSPETGDKFVDDIIKKVGEHDYS